MIQARKVIDRGVAVFGALLTAYAAVRAWRLPITINESVSYLYFSRGRVGDILSPDYSPQRWSPIVGWAANNHVLNTLLVKVFAAVLGPTVLAIRLPNLIGLVGYLVFSWLLLRRLAPPFVAAGGFVLLSCNPILLDYFSLSRGYGLSLALLMGGLVLLWGPDPPPPEEGARAWVGWFLMALAVVASFVILDVYVALAAAATVAAVLEPAPGVPRRRILAHRLTPLAAISLFLAAAVVPNILGLRRVGALYLGGHSGFWVDTVGSLVDGTLYGASDAARIRPILLFIVAALSAALAAALGRGILRRPARRLPAFRWSAILFLSVAMSLLEHSLLGVNFRIERTALYFIPLFVLALTSLAGSLSGSPSPAVRRSAATTLSVLAIAAVLNFFAAANFRRFFLSVEDMDTPELIDDLTRMHAALHRPIRIAMEWETAPGADFYRVVRGLTWLDWENLTDDWTRADCVYVYPSGSEAIRTHGFRLVKAYPRSGNLLGVRAAAPPRSWPPG